MKTIPITRKFFLLVFLWLVSPQLDASCPATTPWSTPVNLSNSGDLTSNVFSAATSAGFMAVWVDSANTGHYAFSSNGTTWKSGLISSSQGVVATASDVFVAGNATGFMVTWIDNSNNGFSSFSTNNGTSWSEAIQINPNSLSLNSTSDVFVAASSAGFVATMIGADNNAYVSFSTGTAAWSAPTQVTNDGSVQNQNNLNSVTGREFVSAAVVGNSCMLAWLSFSDATYSAYFESINPFSSTTPYPIGAIGFFESIPIVAELNGYFMAVATANENSGVVIISTATTTSNWANFSLFTSTLLAPGSGPWVAANQAGFMVSWVALGVDGNPVWTFTSNNGFTLTPVCSILANPSSTIIGPVGLSANAQGFLATWIDTNDNNTYATFYYAPPNAASSNQFVALLEQKYGPLL